MTRIRARVVSALLAACFDSFPSPTLLVDSHLRRAIQSHN